MNEIFRAAKKYFKPENVEIFRESFQEDSVNVEMDQLKNIKSQDISGTSLRVISDGKTGFTSATVPNPEEMAARARESLKLGPDAKFQFPEPSKYKKIKNYDSRIANLNIEKMVEKSYNILNYLKKRRNDLQYDVSIDRYIGKKEILSGKLSVADDITILAVTIVAHIIEEGNFFHVYQQYSSSVYEDKDVEMCDRILNLVNMGKREAFIKAGSYPVVFSPRGFKEIIEPIMVGLNGKSVVKGSSPLMDKLGKKVFPERFNLYDDGTIDGSSSATPFDDEGIAVGKLALIENGILRNYVLDLSTAAQLKMKSTGNGQRSFGSLPRPAPRGVIFSTGNGSVKEMIANVREGVYLDQLIGSLSGNPYSGDFQMSVDLGFKIENGEIVGRLKNVMVSGNAYKIFDRFIESSRDSRWVGNYYLPYASFDQVNFTGNC